MRLFIALNLPPALREAIHAAAAPLREAVGREVSWGRAESIHLTLKFLGEVPEANVPSLAAALRTVAARHLAPRLRVTGVGAFPSLARPRVVWAGLEATPRLELLQHDVEAACATLGHEIEGRPFRPHLTLGRVRAPLGTEQGRALGRAAAATRLEGEALVSTLDLMQSTLTPAGARHEALARLTFREE